MADKRIKLSKMEDFKLMSWLERNLDVGGKITESTSVNDTVRMATEDLGFPITNRHITTRAGTSKEAIFTHKWPGFSGEKGVSEGGHTPRRLALVIDVLNVVVQHISAGEPEFLGELKGLWDELVGMNSRLEDQVEPENGDSDDAENVGRSGEDDSVS